MLLKKLTKIVSGIQKHPLAGKNVKASIIRLLKWQLAQRILPLPVMVNFVENSRLIVQKGMHGATGNIYLGLHDFEEMAFVLHTLRIGDCFGDVGANVGVFSILASVNAGANSVAIEPIPQTYEHLERNVKVNNAENLIRTFQLGVGDKHTTLKFTKNHDTINGVLINQDSDDNTNTVLVEVKTLDEIFSSECPVMLKVDVEGYEWQVLKGASGIIKNKQLKVVIMEIIGSGRAYGITEMEIHQHMLQQGFLPYIYNPFTRGINETESFSKTNTIYIRDIEWVKKRLSSARKFVVSDIEI